MKPQEIVALFRSEMHDEATPPYWSDDLLYPYLDEAQKMFSRLIDGLLDSSSVLSSLAYNVGDTSLTLDPRILKIAHAYRVSDGCPVEIVNYADMEARGLRFDGTTGTVSALIIGMDETTVYPHKIPEIADTLNLVIERLPLDDITEDSSELEVNPQHHMHLLDQMKALAYGNADAEIFNKGKATEFEERFAAYCDKAKKEKERRRHKTRVVKYGGLGLPNSRMNDDYRRR